MLDTTPGSLDRPRRRMTDHKLDTLANSALLRVLQFLVISIAAPLIGWMGSTILDRLNSIEAALAAGRVSNATMELRILDLETYRRAADERERNAAGRLLVLEHEVRTLRGGKP